MKTLLILFFLTIPIRVSAPGNIIGYIINPDPINPFEILWGAICIVESNNNSDAINIHEQAYGIIQIRECKLIDFNKATDNDYHLGDCLKIPVAKEIFMWHCCKFIDIELATRRWNGSINKTDKYWKRVKSVLIML